MAEKTVAGMVRFTLLRRFRDRPRKPLSGMPDQAAEELAKLRV
jgi:hypothetical protein